VSLREGISGPSIFRRRVVLTGQDFVIGTNPSNFSESRYVGPMPG
jgi:hypothetical protein